MKLQYKIKEIEEINHRQLIYLEAFTTKFEFVEANILTNDNFLIDYCKSHLGDCIYITEKE